MKVKKPNLVIILCCIIIILSVVFVFLLDHDSRSIDASQILTIATALIGVVSLSYEMSRTKNIAEAEFIVNLNTNFVSNDDYKHTYDLLEHYDLVNKPDIDLPNSLISNYLTYFETFQLLIDRRVLRIEMIDDLFAYRFFLAVHNPYIQRVKLVKSPANFHNIYKLEKSWIEYRQRIGKNCYLMEYCLSSQLTQEEYQKALNGEI